MNFLNDLNGGITSTTPTLSTFHWALTRYTKCYYYFHLTDDETEPERSVFQSYTAGKAGLKPKSDSNTCCQPLPNNAFLLWVFFFRHPKIPFQG